jgi:hypothetical protein
MYTPKLLEYIYRSGLLWAAEFNMLIFMLTALLWNPVSKHKFVLEELLIPGSCWEPEMDMQRTRIVQNRYVDNSKSSW